MKYLTAFVSLMLAGSLLLVGTVGAAPANFCQRHPTNPNCVVLPTPVPTPTRTPVPTPTPTPVPTPTPTPVPTPTPTPVPTPTPTGTDPQPAFPITGAFYYGWFPESWNQQGFNPFTWYHPSLGFYDTSAVAAQHVASMQRAGIKAGIASWWGQGTPTDGRMSTLLNVAGSFRWTIYYEQEGTTDPSVAQISSDLSYINAHYAHAAGYLRVGGKPVIFVYGGGTDNCTMVNRWAGANTFGFYVVLKVFPGYTTCASQPNSWHQYSPAVPEDHQAGYSFAISPGFWKRNEASPRLGRDINRWRTNIADMRASREPWQLIATFNEWGEGSSIEAATEFGTAYLDALAGITPTPTPTPVPTPTPPPNGTDPVIAAAGDIACDPTANSGAPARCDQAATAQQIVDMNPTAVLTLGDHQYESNTSSQYSGVFNPTWGRFKAKIHPAIGNHEYLTAGAAGYFGYFGAAAGPSPQGYYSFDIGAWHVISLNSECSHIGGCSAGTPQETWLRADLAAHPNACTLAYWHEPRWSSGQHGNATQMTTIWNDLVAAHADIVLSGHNHNYERFPALGANGAPSATGVQEFVVGTGGKNHYPISAAPFSGEVTNDTAFGVLKLVLHPTSYSWQFLSAPGYGFTDQGGMNCR